jgi:hypothetical protein
MDAERLEKYRIDGPPSSMYYIPNFITEDEENYILNKVKPTKFLLTLGKLIISRFHPTNGSPSPTADSKPFPLVSQHQTP